MKREAGGQGEFSVGRIFGAATPPPGRGRIFGAATPPGALVSPEVRNVRTESTFIYKDRVLVPVLMGLLIRTGY